MKKYFTLFCFAVVLISAKAQTPTWANQISCVLYSHCTSCHNPNGLAPFSLLSYADAYNQRFAISNAVSEKSMPPYLPDLSYSHFANERVLTMDEITLINAWVSGGAPSGDTTQAPPAPVYNSSELITTPDMVAKIPTFTVPNVNYDLYQAFVITNPAATTQYITKLEVVPGNRNIVHHVLVFKDNSNDPVANDSAYAGPGYVSFGGIGSNSAELIAGWVPGAGLYELPSGMGIKLNAGERIVVQIHYPNGSANQVDSTKINFKFSANPVRNVSLNAALNEGNLLNGPLAIAPNSSKTFYSQYTVPANVTVISVGPHAHLICTKFEAFAVTPANDTIRLIRINDWDFHWQGIHNFQQPIKIPTGTVLHGIAHYDNTSNNPHNPNNPPQWVTQGESTTDEMMLIYFGYLLYQNGDENIIVDTASHAAHYLDCEPAAVVINGIEPALSVTGFNVFPNPTNSDLNISVSENLMGEQLWVFDISGRKIMSATVTTQNSQLATQNLSNGIYFVKIGSSTKRFVKQ